MEITYNGVYAEDINANDILTFTEIPNILKVSDDVQGARASYHFFWDDDLQSTVTADSQYYVTFLGETVTNVMNPSKANNKRFYISSDMDSTAASFARALRNCGSINSEFNIIHRDSEVLLIAKTIGSIWSNTPNIIQKNIPNDYLSAWGTDGNASSILWGGKVGVDVYSGSTVNDYITTLEKNFYGSECAFDVSPVLSTFSEYGKTIPYSFVLNLYREDGNWQQLGSISGNTAIGYHANQSDKFKYIDDVQPLINSNRGNNGVMTLYTYGNVIPYSVLVSPSISTWNVKLSLKDSAFNELFTVSVMGIRDGSSNIVDDTIIIPMEYYDATYYADFTINNQYVTRFNVIKPLKATEYYQRVLWRNEYGGISFFDFTSTRSESDSIDVETYEKNVFDYYDTNEFEKKKIYSNDYNKQVSLTSHLLEENGKWIFNSLMRSKKVWTVVNDNTYYIIPKSIEVNEDQTYNNIYTAKLTYQYSDI